MINLSNVRYSAELFEGADARDFLRYLAGITTTGNSLPAVELWIEALNTDAREPGFTIRMKDPHMLCLDYLRRQASASREANVHATGPRPCE